MPDLRRSRSSVSTAFSCENASNEPREFTFTILNEVFRSRRVRYQDAPEICSIKLHRELAEQLNHPFTINSLSHILGRRRYPTADSSKNNVLLALLTIGEGWHNNHHHYMASARQGFFWWEVDITFYVLRVLSWFRIVWDLREPPRHVMLGAEPAS
jgi:hypothetical protein